MGPATLIGLVFQALLIVLAFYWFRCAIISRKYIYKMLFFGLLSVRIMGLLIYWYSEVIIGKRIAIKEFAGYYKVTRTDQRSCDHCIAKLNVDRTYEIRESDSVVVKGEWDISSTMDIPGYFLDVENEAPYTVWTKAKIRSLTTDEK